MGRLGWSLALRARRGGDGARRRGVSGDRAPVDEAPVLRIEKLNAAYEQIEKDWLEKPAKVAPKGLAQPVEAVAEVFGSLPH